ncbi:MAG: FAD-dependent oxidoreductase [Haliscomenobacter sp.]|uniref:FAD-dependent oxidoreductase n=1 Tax=Haliscomenobacter sp. TaxID=2717303 RepID=UPI0029A16547|nr:FAD-dependent oxidoreductase [Haliscomenobacter sp.]MDX2069715.1 FAD-dependent oxidoreductase [Haliscomenobacter sp.]
MANDKKPIIFSIDDDPQVLRSLKNDLRNAYKNEYRILSTDSPLEALKSLPDLKKQGDTVALFLSDQRMPNMLGVEFLEQAKTYFPEAKRVLLTAYSDTEAAIRAINNVGLDHYLIKPWDPPSEKLYPVIDKLLDQWQNNYIPEFHGIRLIGYQYVPKSHEIKDFLAGNLFPYQWLDIENDERAQEWLALHNLETKDLPVVLLEDGTPLVNPDITELASKLGLATQATQETYDVVIIGAGPAGLAAAVYGGSEGLKTLLIERRAPGGQAGTSSRIENYLGFPDGLSGSDLTRRAITQATRLGAEFLSSTGVDKIEIEGNYKKLTLRDGNQINTKSVIIATGVDYRKLPAKGADQFTGAGVYYGAATTEANACRDKQIYVVGGGNSAGQGAVYLSQFANKVHIVIRREDLTATMSSYLIDQIKAIPNIEILGKTEVIEALGHESLECIVLENVETKETRQVKADSLFIFIGTRPASEWLPSNILVDDKGFIETGKELKQYPQFKSIWKRQREPFLLETCQPGIFAAGDVRAGAMNRVASAVGEGAMAIKFVHEYLAEV